MQTSITISSLSITFLWYNTLFSKFFTHVQCVLVMLTPLLPLNPPICMVYPSNHLLIFCISCVLVMLAYLWTKSHPRMQWNIKAWTHKDNWPPDSISREKHQLSMSPQLKVGLIDPFPLYSGMFAGLILYQNFVRINMLATIFWVH